MNYQNNKLLSNYHRQLSHPQHQNPILQNNPQYNRNTYIQQSQYHPQYNQPNITQQQYHQPNITQQQYHQSNITQQQYHQSVAIQQQYTRQYNHNLPQNQQGIEHLQNYERQPQRQYDIDNIKIDRTTLVKAIIRPLDTKQNNNDVKTKVQILEKDYIQDPKKNEKLQTLWKDRTNEGYKNILKDEQILKKKIESDKDLIVHRVTQADKNFKEIESKCIEEEKGREQHKQELKSIYSLSKENEYKKKFEYVNCERYLEEKDVQEHTNTKKDRIEFYKKQQQKEESLKQNKNEILESIINQGIFTKEELDSLK